MDEREFTKVVREKVAREYNLYRDDGHNYGDKITADDVAIVWSTKVLNHNKAVAIVPSDIVIMYECTYNGAKQQLYINTYEKLKNTCIEL